MYLKNIELMVIYQILQQYLIKWKITESITIKINKKPKVEIFPKVPHFPATRTLSY